MAFSEQLAKTAFLVWSDDPVQRALLSRTSLSGELSTQKANSPNVGVFFNANSGSKLYYYFDYAVDLRSIACTSKGIQRLKLTVTMRSNAPADAATLPVSVTGPGRLIEPGSTRTQVLAYAPVDGRITHATIDGKRMRSSFLSHQGRMVAVQTVNLAPGQTHKLRYRLTSGSGQHGTPEVRMTPGVRSSAANVSASACR
jgi:hypothetical protein